jgi:archaellum biogenesis ATPase FlaH
MTLKDNPSELLQTLSAIKEELSGLESGSTVRIGHPFQCIIRRDQTNQMRTGLRIIDEKMGGIGFGEFIILLGFTGSGKTALATYLTLKMVTQNFTVIYITLEEPKENISNRFYSQYFSINYTDLHKGRANMILDQKFGEMEPAQRQQLIEKLHIHDMKEQTPISAEQIQLWLEKHHKETGINPDLVIIDQLEYLEPNLLNVKSQQWEQIERIAKECDKLSEYKVGREHPFGLLLLHQLNGDPKIAMKKKDIAGFKGIDRSADTLLGLGRDGLQSMDFMLACMKTRHTAPFNIKLKGELEFMRFKESTGGIIV